MSEGWAQGGLRDHLDTCWSQNFPTKLKKKFWQGLYVTIQHHSPSLRGCSNQKPTRQRYQIQLLLFSPVFQPLRPEGGLLKTEKHLDQVEFYWKAHEEPDLCV